jgi:hypothetical protein
VRTRIGVPRVLAQERGDVERRGLAYHQIEQDEVGAGLAGDRQPVGPVAGEHDSVAGRAEIPGEEIAEPGMIDDQQQGACGLGARRQTSFHRAPKGGDVGAGGRRGQKGQDKARLPAGAFGIIHPKPAPQPLHDCPAPVQIEKHGSRAGQRGIGSGRGFPVILQDRDRAAGAADGDHEPGAPFCQLLQRRQRAPGLRRGLPGREDRGADFDLTLLNRAHGGGNQARHHPFQRRFAADRRGEVRGVLGHDGHGTRSQQTCGALDGGVDDLRQVRRAVWKAQHHLHSCAPRPRRQTHAGQAASFAA